MRKESRYKRVDLDHYTSILTFGNLPRVRERKEDRQAKEGGWKQYDQISDEYIKVLEEVVESKDTNIGGKMRKFEDNP